MPARGPEQKVPDIHDSACYIAAHEISIHAFEVSWGKDTPRQNAVAESGSEPLDLILEFRKHVYVRTVGHVTVRPRSVLACESA